MAVFNTSEPSSLIPVECFDTLEECWFDVSPLPQSITSTEGCVATSLPDGLVYLVGGHDRACLCYSFKNDQWTTLRATPNCFHIYPAIFTSNGCLVLCGGGKSGGEIEEYDPDANKWHIQPWKMPRLLFHHFAVMMK